MRGRKGGKEEGARCGFQTSGQPGVRGTFEGLPLLGLPGLSGPESLSQSPQQAPEVGNERGGEKERLRGRVRRVCAPRQGMSLTECHLQPLKELAVKPPPALLGDASQRNASD